MTPQYWDASSPNDRDDAGAALELLDQKTDKRSILGSIDNEWTTTPTSRLPPKPLSPRSTTRIVRTAFWTGFAVVIIIIGLSLLAAWLYLFMPDTSAFQVLNSPISCDLMNERRSRVQNAFTINLRGATHLTFTEAKAIDVVWQLFVGAGGRFLMAWISYMVFMDGLTRLAEQSPVSFSLYTSLTFSTTSLFAAWYSLKAVFFSRGGRTKCFLLWFCLSTLYVLGFPTLMSATAGYLTPSTAGFNMSDGTFLQPSSPNLRSCYSVSGGALIGHQNGTVAEGPPVSVYDATNPYGSCSLDKTCPDIPNLWQDYPLFASLLNGEVARVKMSLSTALIIAFAVTLNYSHPVYDNSERRYSIDSNYTTNITIEGRLYHFRNWMFREGITGAYDSDYCYLNKTIPNLQDLAQCLPESYFVWGFSSLMVYINLSLFMVWLFGMYLVWLDARIYSALCRSGRKVRGHYRAVADLSEAMKEVLGDEICAYSDSELARELSKQPGMTYYASDPHDGGASHIGLSSIGRSRVPFNSTKMYGSG